ncbi:hypothetical protein Y032_0024g1071 [Ancylostoma ceylanicum]|uniref:G-protein coupled receptors family 1 profile domain-containing protein n=1 Tax=Ancylostoma ceylanicum TaxID=53326 RepID=A0A016UVF3_9BILA|nr:hypothetical protein Y032_0024g1071 [Ancylostoma ceylanicum]
MAAPKAFDGLSKDLSDSDRLELCKMYGTDVVTFIWYRTVQVIWIFIAGIAIFNVSRVYFRYIKSSKLHTNIQILLTLFMFSAVLINTTFIVAQAYQFTLSFVFGEPCDVFLPRTFYIIFNICYGFFTELYLLSKATMIIERSLATIYSSCYEHMKSLPGFLGAIISILMATGVEVYIYYGATFDQQHITITSTSAEVSGRINNVLIFNVSCCAVTMIIMTILLLVNMKRKKNAIGCVSYRFQVEENIATTNFIAKIAFVQLIAFSIQSLGGLLVRLYSKYLFDADDIPAMKSLKLSLHVMPLFTIIMSIVIELSIRRTARYRHTRLLNMVNIKDGAKLNSDFLAIQWNQSDPKWPRFERNSIC